MQTKLEIFLNKNCSKLEIKSEIRKSPRNLDKVTFLARLPFFANFRKNLKMRLKTGFVIREIAGEKMILMRAGNTTDMTKAVMFNSTSEFLWNSLQVNDFDENDVKDLLTGKYDVEPEVAMADALRWITSMHNAGLIEN